MIHFSDFRQECLFRNKSFCSYWDKSTECHILACPFYSHKTAPKKRKALQKQLQDKITFSTKDFDRIGNTVLDVIEKNKDEKDPSFNSRLNSSKTSTVAEKTISRMHCIACGELITDDMYITVRDPKGVIIYLHSKGKCSPRHDQLKIVRDRWLRVHQKGETVSDSQEPGV